MSASAIHVGWCSAIGEFRRMWSLVPKDDPMPLTTKDWVRDARTGAIQRIPEKRDYTYFELRMMFDGE
jgi:hypothetical protein